MYNVLFFVEKQALQAAYKIDGIIPKKEEITMIDNIEKRVLSLLLAVIMIISLIPLSVIDVQAKKTLDTSVLGGNIAIVTTGGTSGQRTTATVNADGSIVFGVTSNKDSCEDSYKSQATHIVRLSNTTEEEITISFECTVSKGTLTIDGATVESGDKLTYALAANGGAIYLTLTSP